MLWIFSVYLLCIPLLYVTWIFSVYLLCIPWICSGYCCILFLDCLFFAYYCIPLCVTQPLLRARSHTEGGDGPGEDVLGTERKWKVWLWDIQAVHHSPSTSRAVRRWASICSQASSRAVVEVWGCCWRRQAQCELPLLYPRTLPSVWCELWRPYWPLWDGQHCVSLLQTTRGGETQRWDCHTTVTW